MLQSTLLKKSAVALGQRRWKSEVASTLIREKKADYNNFSKHWLQDISTYPIMAVMGVAGVLCSGALGAFLLCNPEIQISPHKRASIMRTWGDGGCGMQK